MRFYLYLVTCHQHDLNTGQHSLMLLTYSCLATKIASSKVKLYTALTSQTPFASVWNTCLFPCCALVMIMSFTLLGVLLKFLNFASDSLFSISSVALLVRHSSCRKEVRSPDEDRQDVSQSLLTWAATFKNRQGKRQTTTTATRWFFRSWFRRGDSSEFACH